MRAPSSVPRILCSSLLLLFSLNHHCAWSSAKESNDLYKLLGVARTATTKQIKSAYRQKALDTHPDKNPDVPPEESAEAFRKVVEAFEILSDKNSRARYDRTGQTDPNSNNGFQNNQWSGRRRQQHSSTFTWTFRQARPKKLKDQFRVQQAMSRVLHVVSLEQLETIMLDDDTLTLERNLLICFCSAGDTEDWVLDEMVFPYPFAHKSSQGIWWEDLLQTVQIRFHKANELTRFFGIDSEKIRETKTPAFLFAKRGTKLLDMNGDDRPSRHYYPTITTRNRNDLETWVWQRIEVEVIFRNHHSHPVEIYWIHDTRATLQVELAPGENATHTTMLSHEWLVRDARVDRRKDSPGRHRLTETSSLLSHKVLSDESPQDIVVPLRKCFDMSGHCPYWHRQGECRRNPLFMNEVCRVTCQRCDPTKDVGHDSKPEPEKLTKEGSGDETEEEDDSSDQNDEL